MVNVCMWVLMRAEDRGKGEFNEECKEFDLRILF